MKFDYDKLKYRLLRNPLHIAIIWCGLRHSEKWRGMRRHMKRRCDLAFVHSSGEAAYQFYGQAVGTLAMYLKFVSIEALRQWPLLGGTCHWLLARLDWQVIAAHVMADAYFEELMG